MLSCFRYDWSPGSLADGIHEASLAQNSLYVPMIWGEKDLTEARLRDLDFIGDSSSYLLGFNEPNYGHQVTEKQYANLNTRSDSRSNWWNKAPSQGQNAQPF